MSYKIFLTILILSNFDFAFAQNDQSISLELNSIYSSQGKSERMRGVVLDKERNSIQGSNNDYLIQYQYFGKYSYGIGFSYFPIYSFSTQESYHESGLQVFKGVRRNKLNVFSTSLTFGKIHSLGLRMNGITSLELRFRKYSKQLVDIDLITSDLNFNQEVYIELIEIPRQYSFVFSLDMGIEYSILKRIALGFHLKPGIKYLTLNGQKNQSIHREFSNGGSSYESNLEELNRKTVDFSTSIFFITRFYIKKY